MLFVASRLLRGLSMAQTAPIVSFVNSAMPTATPWLLSDCVEETTTADAPWRTHEEAFHCASGGEMLVGNYLQQRHAAVRHAKTGTASLPFPVTTPTSLGGVLTSVNALRRVSPECVDKWEALYQLSDPFSFSNSPDAPPHCGWTRSAVSHAWLPLWTPHAVVHYGGYESGDLDRLLLGNIVSMVPTLEDVPLTHDESPLYPTNKSAYPQRSTRLPQPARHCRQQDPLYVRRSAHHKTAQLQSRGCRILTPDLLELSLVTSTQSHGDQLQRQRTFLAFASPSVTLSDLCREPSAVRRQKLRTAFGYSFHVLKESLPFPLLSAASLLQRWHVDCTGAMVPCAAPFWVSAVAHRWSEAEDVITQVTSARSLVSPDHTLYHRWHTALNQLCSSLMHSELSPLSVANTRTLAAVLAATTAESVHDCAPDQWSCTYAVNFFLRGEDFSRQEGVAQLAQERVRWTAQSRAALIARALNTPEFESGSP